MAFVDNLKRSRPSFYHLSQFQRLQAGHVSNPPQAAPSSMPLPSVNPGTCSNSHESHVRRSITRWLLGLAGGSTLGVLCWPSDSSNSFSSFFDWSTAETDESRSAFRKLSLPDYSSKFLFPDDYRRKVFFKYEKRIRQKSPPEKVFEYFASFRAPDGELLMRPADLMRAVVPVFPPSESHLVRDGYLIGERSPGELRCPPSEFFMLFDVNNDGLVSFKEYIFFVTLLGIPEASFSVAFKMFDTDNNSEIDKDEFKKVMALMRAHNRQGAAHRDGIRTGLKVAGHVDNGGLVEYFFGEDGNGRLRYDKFVQFLKDLHNEILRLEFAHYDFKLQGTISAKDFALSMVAAADMGDISMLLDQVSRLDNEEHLSGIRISFDEFKDFAELRKRLLPLSLALFSYGEVNGLLMKEDFERAVSKVCDISLSDNVVDIIFHVFDLNCDGNLSIDEFIRVLHKREMDIAQPVKSGFMRFLPSRNF